MAKEKNFKVEIERNSNGITVRITDFDYDQFDEAYELVDNLFRRANLINKKLEAERIVSPLWVSSKSGRKLSNLVTQSSYRIALSLLQAYPSGKLFSDIVNETELPKSSTHRLLTGQKQSVAKYFTKDRDYYRLTSLGLDWIVEEVIPFLVDQAGLIEFSG